MKKFSKLCVIAMFVSIYVFTVTMTVIFVACGTVPDSLVAAFFGWFSVEGGALALIKNCETKHKRKIEKKEKKDES